MRLTFPTSHAIDFPYTPQADYDFLIGWTFEEWFALMAFIYFFVVLVLSKDQKHLAGIVILILAFNFFIAFWVTLDPIHFVAFIVWLTLGFATVRLTKQGREILRE